MCINWSVLRLISASRLSSTRQSQRRRQVHRHMTSDEPLESIKYILTENIISFITLLKISLLKNQMLSFVSKPRKCRLKPFLLIDRIILISVHVLNSNKNCWNSMLKSVTDNSNNYSSFTFSGVKKMPTGGWPPPGRNRQNDWKILENYNIRLLWY